MKQEAMKIIDKLKEKSLNDPDSVASGLESMLEQYHMDDGFGTEGETDPRGDFRDQSYTMWNVEGDDEVKNQHERNILVLDRMNILFNEDEYFSDFVVDMTHEFF